MYSPFVLPPFAPYTCQINQLLHVHCLCSVLPLYLLVSFIKPFSLHCIILILNVSSSSPLCIILSLDFLTYVAICRNPFSVRVHLPHCLCGAIKKGAHYPSSYDEGYQSITDIEQLWCHSHYRTGVKDCQAATGPYRSVSRSAPPPPPPSLPCPGFTHIYLKY